jgi:uncharacterized protein (DUF2141 family)
MMGSNGKAARSVLERSWSLLLLILSAVSPPALADQAAPAPPTPANEIRVVAQGLKDSKGKMFCELFEAANAKDYPTKPEHAVMKTVAPITDKTAACTFSGVKPGTYAVAVFHDENDNGKLDTGFLGIPTEPTGASNDARGSMGPPKFKDAQFVYSGGALVVTVKLE